MTVQADLASEDAILDDALTRLFVEHRAAKDAGNTAEARELQLSIRDILAEQSRRLDAWINEHLTQGAT